MKASFNTNSLPSPNERYRLQGKLGAGIFGEVYRAADSQASGKSVAVKIRIYNDETEEGIQDEYKILRDFTNHSNIVDFYGIYCERADGDKKIWFVLELCEGGSVIDIVQKLIAKDNKMSEEHIAFVLKETIKALIYLHENKVMHRNIRCSNILLTKDGEVKLSDFGLSCQVSGTLGKRNTCIGSPSWMAPEIITGVENGYGNRSDVWALGVTAIEMADGKAPFQDMHPTRALFQIVRNPPPGLEKPSSWSNEINDFISECLEKNPDHRPFVMELQEHPFIQNVPDNDYHLSQELKKLIIDLNSQELNITKPLERVIKNGFLKTDNNTELESLQVEDLAALDVLTEDKIMDELQTKLAKGHFMTFIGEILLILNPNVDNDIYNEHFHKKYEFKSRSDNAPHIYAVADSAYQDAIHHNEPQHIVFSGESRSGKTTNMVHALEHLTYLGAMKNNTAERIQKASKVIRAAISSSTLINTHSTRSIFQTQVTYGSSGKLSGAIFWVYQLEKWRVSSTDMTHANFDLLYYFYDAMEAEDKLETYYLEKNRKHRYLRMLDEPSKSFKDIRYTPQENAECYKELISCLEALDWEPEDINTLETVLGAILLLGNVRFKESKDGLAEIENSDEAIKVAKLLSLEQPKFLWALLNYCVVERGSAIKRKHSSDEARDARDTLANSLYKRIVDWMINLINFKLSFGRSVFGDKYVINLLDLFGFECYHRNRLEQLIVNTTNEQIQFLYNQRIFAWEIQEQNEEDIPLISIQYYDNKYAVDQLMGRPLGLFYILDEASTGGGQEFIMTTIRNSSKGPFVKLSGSHEFSVAHYTGKINYDCREMAEKNKDFLPPEMIETMRSSCDIAIQQMFRNKLTKAGNLTLSSNLAKIVSPNQAKKTKAEKESVNHKARKFNTLSRGQFSQVHRMRTAAATYRATSLELLKQLSIGGGTHFVRCIRPDLNDNAKGFQPDVVRQQLRALAVLDTAKARQRGFSSRIPFAEFIRRYKFLAFDFDENVEVTKENCRLLLIRLKMEGWVIGKTKVFLKYYNEEFLARLYELQVKKIIKVQSMMRAFLTRRRALQSKSKSEHLKEVKKQCSLNLDEGEAALLIQKAYRGYVVRKAYGPLIKSTGQIDEATADFLKKFAVKWKSRSIFQVLLQYRAVRFQDLVNFSQQVHIYNQAVMEVLINTSVSVLLDRVDPQAKGGQFLGQGLPAVRKLPFRVDQLQYYDTSHMCHPGAKSGDTFASIYDSDHEQWDEPLKRRSASGPDSNEIKPKSSQAIINVPFCRDPTQPIPKLTPIPDSPKEAKTNKPPQNWDSRPQVYKKKQPAKPNYQPPTPWTSNKEMSSPIKFTPPGLRKTEHSSSLYGINTPNIMDNPIKEMQALAKSADDLNDDDAPFNFQAMLKRTPKNRASMKRSGEELSIHNGKPPTGKSHNKGPAPATPKELKRRDSRELINTVVKRSDSDFELEGRDNIMENERFELAPGIMVEGTVTDL